MQSLKHHHEMVKYLEAQLRGPRHFDGDKLKGLNKFKVLDSQLLWLCLLVELRSKSGVQSRKQSLAREARVLALTDVRDWLTGLDICRDWLISSCDHNWSLEEALDIARQKLTDTSITLLLDFLRPLIDGWFVRSDIQAFAYLLQAYSFPKRLSLDIKTLEEAAYKKWIACENHMVETSDMIPESLFSRVRDVIADWFPMTDWKFIQKRITPHHGPGSIASWERYVPHNVWQYKTDNMVFTPELVDFLTEIGFTTDEYSLMQRPYNGLAVYSSERIKEYFHDNICAKVIFVNKSWKTYRTISAEPICKMWVQQGVGDAINWYLTQPSLTEMADYYAVNSEGRNKKLALQGSIRGEYATYDFSSASDCVSYTLTKYLLSRSWLSKVYDVCRTRYAETPDGSVYEIAKHAQMGSRMCFPVMTIVIAAIARVVVNELEGTTNAALTKRFGLPPFVVYGDDIVIKAKYGDRFVELATQFGLIVNIDKSFYKTTSRHFYRESCGVEALDGVDITPIYLSRKFPGLPYGNFVEFSESGDKTMSSEHCRTLASAIQLANDMKEYPLVRTLIVQRIRNAAGDLLLYDKSGEVGLYTDDVRPNHHLSVKYDEDLQAPYVEAFVIRPDKKRYWDAANAYVLPQAALYEELRLGYGRSERDHNFLDRGGHLDRRMPDPSESLLLDEVTYVEDVVGQVDRYYWPDL